MARSR
jgi:hypothetical protein